MLETAMESAVDVGSFGILQPDIIPQDIEEQHPLASTIGHVAGSIAGFVPSMGLSRVATHGIFKLFGYSARISETLQGMYAGAQTIAKATPFAMSMTNIATGSATFALHDMTREFIRQVKKDDYGLYELGQQAVGGAMTGALFGSIGSVIHTAHPLVQANVLGGTVALAEAINDASEGVDVLSKDYAMSKLPLTYLQGFILGAWNSRGYAERQQAKLKMAHEAYPNMLEKENILIRDKNGNITYNSVMKLIKQVAPELKPKEMPQEVVEAAKILEKWDSYKRKTPRRAQGKIHELQRTLKMDETAYKAFLEEITGKTSTKQFNQQDYDAVMNELKTVVDIKKKGLNLENLRTSGLFEQSFSPASRLILTTGLQDVVGDLKVAKTLMTIEKSLANDVSYVMEKQWTDWFTKTYGKQPVIQRAKNVMFNRTTKAAEAFEQYILGKRPVSELPKDMQGLVKEYRGIMDMMWERMNQVLIATGQTTPDKPLNKVEYYMRRIIDVNAMKAQGMEANIPELQYRQMPSRKPVSGTRLEPTERSRNPAAADLPVKHDPFMAMRNAVHYDLKAIYLHEPLQLVTAQLKTLSRAETGVDPLVWEQANKYIRHVIFEQQTEATRTINKQIERLSKTSAGKMINKVIEKFDSDMGGNPMSSLAYIFGNTVSAAYIGLRPKLAIRNAFQWVYTHGMVDTPSLAKALVGKKDALFTELQNKSLFRKMSLGMAEEHQRVGLSNPTSRVLYDMFEKSQMFNIDISMKAAYHQTLSYITNPKYEKKLGWATPEGIKKRAELRAAGKEWQNVVDKSEIPFIAKEMDFIAQHTQFLYNTLGMPMVYRSAVARPLFKLQSFAMNYWYNYLGELAHRAITGRPYWAEGADPGKFKLPWNNKHGYVKHFVGLGVMIAALEKIGLDYSSLVAASWAPGRDESIKGVKLGVLNMRPSPAVNILLSIKDAFSDDEYTRVKSRNWLYDSLPIPGRMAYKDISRALTEEEGRSSMFFYKKYERKKKSHISNIFRPVNLTQPFPRNLTQPFPRNRAFRMKTVGM
jgi:hypothetical protein